MKKILVICMAVMLCVVCVVNVAAASDTCSHSTLIPIRCGLPSLSECIARSYTCTQHAGCTVTYYTGACYSECNDCGRVFYQQYGHVCGTAHKDIYGGYTLTACNLPY